MNILDLIGRKKELFEEDLKSHEDFLKEVIGRSSFLVIGGAGAIGQAVVKEIFARNPRKLHVVDISENNLVELVRDLRSSVGYISGEFRAYALDAGSWQHDVFFDADGRYDFVLNLSALKHVRSEKDPYTLMRMIEVNILNTLKTVTQAIEKGTEKYFAVSTDKAANPVNMMGASKRIMEMFLMRSSEKINISTARFANVAFSDGSLLHGFNLRIRKKQPIVAPSDVKRYFVTEKEAGELCLLSCILGENRDIFFPKLSENLHLITFAEIAENYLSVLGYKPFLCTSEEEARSRVSELEKIGKWPCLFTPSDTTGEKDFEEFFTEAENLDMIRFSGIGIIKNQVSYDHELLEYFLKQVNLMKERRNWTKENLVKLFQEMLPGFQHNEKGKYLDEKM